ncbi:hypothetical protein NPX13_g1523 [Xylaria arbuscula]|uniref:Amino acid permease/ SLC12A domain-containing protein n=1 Tax=Xylaria arbuscula TaxID=114810 RepID=A0A9W8NKW5_9PEZI|nr:hypothetical protein NPX13_g1523 [Xylaria arbuscula]
MAWKAQGRDLREIPYRAPLGVWGSWIGLFLVALCLIATFYNALYPSPNSSPDAETFFAAYLATFVVIVLYLFWKVWSRNWKLYVNLMDIDLVSGSRPLDPSEFDNTPEQNRSWGSRILRSLF